MAHSLNVQHVPLQSRNIFTDVASTSWTRTMAVFHFIFMHTTGTTLYSLSAGSDASTFALISVVLLWSSGMRDTFSPRARLLRDIFINWRNVIAGACIETLGLSYPPNWQRKNCTMAGCYSRTLRKWLNRTLVCDVHGNRVVVAHDAAVRHSRWSDVACGQSQTCY